jgi:hypothetical protein
MDVFINELTSTVEVTSPSDALLDAAVLQRVVQAVMARLREDELSRRWEERERQPWRGPRR